MSGPVLHVLAALLIITSCTAEGNREISSTSQYDPIEDVNSLIRKQPDNADLYFERAKLFRSAGSSGDAILDLERALSIDSMNAVYPILLTDLYLESLKSRTALATIERAARVHPRDRSILLKLAEVQLILRDYTPATQTIRTLLEIHPSDTDALVLLSIVFREQGDLKRASQSLQTVVELDGNNYEAWTMLGNIYEETDEPLILQCYDNALAVKPDHIPALHSKAFYLQNNSRIGDAILIYLDIHEIDSTYAEAYLNAGILFLEEGDLDSAETEFATYTDLRTADPLGPFYRGIIQEMRGNLDMALGYFQRAAALAPGVRRFSQKAEETKALLDQSR